MPGFVGIISPNNQDRSFELTMNNVTIFSKREKVFSNAKVAHFINNKFIEDKIFHEDEEIFIGTEGTLLNSTLLKKEYAVSTNFQLIKVLFNMHPENFPSFLRGDFSGVIFDKKNNTWIIFSNHYSSKPIYYYYDDESDILLFSSNFQSVVEVMKLMKINYSLSLTGAYYLITFGYMLDDETLVSEIKKLPPGTLVTHKNNSLDIKNYYKLQNTKHTKKSMSEIIDILHERFSHAIQLEYNKDIEYNYNHISTLSGGLDSRMNVIYAHKCGYDNLLNITFCQSGYLDEIIAKQISANLNNEFLFFSLDNGNYLLDIESPIIANSGLVFYSGAANFLKMISLINLHNFGALHTGQIGDAVLGSFLKNPYHIKPESYSGIYSSKLLPKIIDDVQKVSQKYENNELFLFYNRAFNGATNGNIMIQQYTEFVSPFMDKDLLDFCLTIPPSMRVNNKLYFEWINTRAPEAAKYKWEKTGVYINTPTFIRKVHTFQKLLKSKIGVNKKYAMGPSEYWFKTNKYLKEFTNKHFNLNIFRLDHWSELKKDATNLFEHGSSTEKRQVLTLLEALKMYLD